MQTAEAYYNWTDAQTPGLPDDGKAFFGRDAMAITLSSGARQLGCEIFSVDGNQVTFHLDEAVFRKLWDHYYVPYHRRLFYGQRQISAPMTRRWAILLPWSAPPPPRPTFPTAVNTNDRQLSYRNPGPARPTCAGGENFAVQQGAGMVVTTSTPKRNMRASFF